MCAHILPKVVAVGVGAGLAVSGLLMQTLFRNPLAGPFVLGISSGASLGVAMIILMGSIISVAVLSSKVSILLAAGSGAAAILIVIIFIIMVLNYWKYDLYGRKR